MTGGGFQLDTGDGKSSTNSIQQLSPSARKVIGDNLSHLDHGISDWLLFNEIKHDHSFERRSEDCLAAFFPVIKAIQAALTLGTGGPFDQWVQVWILANAKGCSEMMENNRERRAAPVAAGGAAGIASGIIHIIFNCNSLDLAIELP
ncbi:hypothetical protein HPP92_026839 [Vanilla planifolia]|uniref:Uncharacterized protein n=1 Tax=Vanilla planifolia TaxID=51239 RepID=A0A835PD09_VANPL|nr:hypothetical protein HPP92_026839 [Vanilla planifolia]